MEPERRRNQRFPFIAAAELLDESSGSQMTTRISDLSLDGCYVDTINPLPSGTPVVVRILTGAHSFEAPARVVYAVEHLGMGLVFREVQSQSRIVLQEWLSPDTIEN